MHLNRVGMIAAVLVMAAPLSAHEPVQKASRPTHSPHRREVAEMKLLIADIQRNGSRGSALLPARPEEVAPDMQPNIREAVR